MMEPPNAPSIPSDPKPHVPPIKNPAHINKVIPPSSGVFSLFCFGDDSIQISQNQQVITQVFIPINDSPDRETLSDPEFIRQLEWKLQVKITLGGTYQPPDVKPDPSVQKLFLTINGKPSRVSNSRQILTKAIKRGLKSIPNKWTEDFRVFRENANSAEIRIYLPVSDLSLLEKRVCGKNNRFLKHIHNQSGAQVSFDQTRSKMKSFGTSGIIHLESHVPQVINKAIDLVQGLMKSVVKKYQSDFEKVQVVEFSNL